MEEGRRGVEMDEEREGDRVREEVYESGAIQFVQTSQEALHQKIFTASYRGLRETDFREMKYMYIVTQLKHIHVHVLRRHNVLDLQALVFRGGGIGVRGP